MVFFDPLYFLFLAPGLALSAWAQTKISRAYAEGSRIASTSGITGEQAAAEILRVAGVGGVSIESVRGPLSDHYDPTRKVLRLSEDVYSGRSLAALGIAAHEVGHAVQDATHYAPLVVRNLIVPVAGIGSNVAWVVILAGLVVGFKELVVLGMILFSGTVIFQLVTLPVEFDASRRAHQALATTGLVSAQEDAIVAKVLNAAAWTYVAAALTSILTLLYYLYRFGLLGGGRNRDD